MKVPLGQAGCLLLYTALTLTAVAQNNPEVPTSDNDKMLALPAPGAVTIDGKLDDWDLSAGMWSYNDPTLVEKYSSWTHLMWDEKGVYVLVRYHDPTPMKNATRGEDFHMSWQADAMQARLIFDDQTPEEHQMHVNLFYSSSEQKPYMIVHHGGFKKQPPFDATGPLREDQLEKYGSTMEAFGGKVAFKPWEDGKGYNLEAFWPWSYLRASGKPMKGGDSFTFGFEAMWGSPEGETLVHRLVDNIKNDKINRIFFFRARPGWGKVTLSDKGQSELTEAQKQLHASRLKMFVDYDTVGSIAIPYTLADEKREVTIAIDDAKGRRVRNLFGQFPRGKGENTDYWDGLDDSGLPVSPGTYTATIVDHAPYQLRFVNSLYNAATPPWRTTKGSNPWGSNHGHPTSASTRGNITLLGFTGTEGSSGIMRVDENGRILWTEGTETMDITPSDRFAFLLSRDSWTARALIRRLHIEKGNIVPFENEARSTEVVLPIDYKEMSDGSLAFAHGKLFAVVPGKCFFRVHPDTGEIEATLPHGNLVSVTDRDDTLWGLFADGTVSQLDTDGKKKGLAFSTNVTAPSRLAVSHDRQRFAISKREGNQVFLFDSKGKDIGTIGEAYASVDGMRPAGRYIETNLIKPLGLDFDAKDRLWIAEGEDTNRRVTCWSAENKLEAQFWGGADYGGMAGFPMTHDSTRFIAHGVEFKLDPTPDIYNRPTAEKPLIFHPVLSKTRGFVYSFNGNEYAVTTPGMLKQYWVTIAKRNNAGVFQEVVRIEYGDDRKKELGKAWTDRNENGIVDEGEMFDGFEGRRHYWSTGWMRPDLTFVTPDQKVYRPKEFTKTGVPIYDFASPEAFPNTFKPDFWANGSGTIVVDSAGNVSDGINFATVDGRTGSYPNPYGRHDAPAARRGLLIAPFRSNGLVENVPGVGSITAIGGDRGEWFLMSLDGLYLSSILQDSKADVTLDETYVGQESFGGFIWRDEKERVMVQLGGFSYTLLEITGLETTRKTSITIKATAEQIAEGERAAQARRDASPKEADTIRIARVEKLPSEAPADGTKETLIPGALTVRVQEAGNKANWFRVALAHNGTDLAIAYQVSDPNPWNNAEKRFTHAFIGGDALDLQLQVPGRGEIRLLAAPLDGENALIYWQKRAKEKENPTTYVVSNNPANAQQFDVVKRLTSGKVVLQKGFAGYTALITVPLAELGLEPGKTEKLRGIAGIILSDPSGTNRAQRLYWFDKTTGIVSDVPSEARLNPHTWGPLTLDK